MVKLTDILLGQVYSDILSDILKRHPDKETIIIDGGSRLYYIKVIIDKNWYGISYDVTKESNSVKIEYDDETFFLSLWPSGPVQYDDGIKHQTYDHHTIFYGTSTRNRTITYHDPRIGKLMFKIFGIIYKHLNQ